MDNEVIEVFRYIIPHNKIINDNSGQHYKTLQGKTKWLVNLATNAIEGFKEMPGGFMIPSKEEVQQVIDKDRFSLVLEHWKCQRRFDLANYEMTYKPIIDVFSYMGYWNDDAWKYLSPVIFSGGDHSVWDERSIRYKGDNLPDSISKEWWLDNESDPIKDSFIRILAVNKTSVI